ncbi:MAG: hypothetical protein M1820_002031 [Bogoriella megaspora]|nr:MAG: hypothetical protein M1820_002031 [Bogoriella megaspora]
MANGVARSPKETGALSRKQEAAGDCRPGADAQANAADSDSSSNNRRQAVVGIEDNEDGKHICKDRGG